MWVLGRPISNRSRASILVPTVVAALALMVGASDVSAQGNAVEPGKLIQADPDLTNRFGDRLGSSVAVSGDTAIIGASTKDDFGDLSGAVYVFVRDPINRDAWTQVAKLLPSDAHAGQQFGRSVGISGDTVVVGAVGDDEAGQFTGSAYIFERNQGGSNAWGQTMKLRSSGAAGGDVFGESVSISGDRIVVGAPQDQGPPFPRPPGFATIFERNHGGIAAWGEVVRLTPPSNGQPGDGFGRIVAVSGDTVLAGVLAIQVTAFVFARNQGGPDAWGQVAKLSGTGSSVAISDETAIVGSSIFARDRATGAWVEVTTLVPVEAHDSSFGSSVAISGDTAVVGAANDDEKGGLHSFSGSAFVFRRDQGGANAWGQLFKLTASDGIAGDLFGSSVAISGLTAIVGAPTFGDKPGAAYACQLDQVNFVSGACRRAIPVVNNLVTMSDLTTSCCVANQFTITATFTNTSQQPIHRPFLEVISISSGLMLQNADGGPGGLGAMFTLNVGDDTLSPGESTRVSLVLAFQTPVIWFHVNVRGEPDP
jgi:hypothetical protein